MKPSDGQSDHLDRLGHYEIHREIGRGGQATVHLATDLRLRRQVALKILHSHGFRSSDLMRRFQREAQVASRLDHPGICPVYDTGTDDGVAWIAMRFIEGESLAQRLATARQVPESFPSFISLGPESLDEEADEAPESSTASGPSSRVEILHTVHMIEKVARALHCAHEAGIVHRDIKPGNIMVTPSEEPVILDFGLAGDLGDEEATLTRSGDILGTPAYMAPEQIQGAGHLADGRTDVYALGVLLYECLSLQRPFNAPTRQALYRAILEEEPSELRRQNPAIPRDLSVAIETALAKEPDRRYQTAGDFAEDLRRIRELEPIKAKPISAWGRSVRWAQRNRLIASLTILLFVVLMLFVAILGVQGIRLRKLATREEQTARQERLYRQLAERSSRLAQSAKAESQGHLARSLYDQARVLLLSRQAGRRWDSLRLLARAEGLRRGLLIQERETPEGLPEIDELRGEAINAALQADSRRIRTLSTGTTSAPALSPDQRFMAVAHLDNSRQLSGLRVHDLLSGQVILQWDETQLNGLSSALAPGGGQLVVFHLESRRLVVWDLVRQRPLRTLPLATTPDPSASAWVMDSLSFSPDGRFVAGLQRALGGEGKVSRLLVWDLGDPEATGPLVSQEAGPWVRFSQDSSSILLALPSRQIARIDLNSPKKPLEKSLSILPVGELSVISPDGGTLITTGQGLTRGAVGLLRFDLEHFASRAVVLKRLSARPTAIAFHPSGRTIAAAFPDGRIRLLGSRRGRTLLDIQTRHPRILSLSFDGEATLHAFGSSGVLTSHEIVASPKGMTVLDLSRIKGVSRFDNFAFSPDGASIVLHPSRGRELQVVGLRKQQILAQVDLPGARRVPIEMFFDPKGSGLTLRNRYQTLKWKLASPKPAPRLKTPKSGAKPGRAGVRLHPILPDALLTPSLPNDKSAKKLRRIRSSDDRILALLRRHEHGESIALRDLVLGKTINRLNFPHKPGRNCIAQTSISPASRWVLVVLNSAAGANGRSDPYGYQPRVAVFGLHDSRPHLVIPVPSANGVHHAFHPTKNQLALADPDGSIAVWDIDRGERIFRFRAHSSPVKHIAFTPDGESLASTDGRGQLILWHLDLLQSELRPLGLGW